MNYRKKVDANQASIVAALRKIRALVHSTASLGEGFPDLVVAHGGRVWLLEVKDGSKPASAQKLTEAEQEFHERWAGYVHVVNTPEAALKLLLSNKDKTGQKIK